MFADSHYKPHDLVDAVKIYPSFLQDQKNKKPGSESSPLAPNSPPPSNEKVWSTPRASDGEKGGPNQSFGAGGTPLPAQTAQWMTPNAGGGTGYMSGTHRDTWRPTLEGQVMGYEPVLHQGRPKMDKASKKRLNPLFVEWLMGWPLGWTDFGPVETESYRSKLRSRLRLLLATTSA